MARAVKADKIGKYNKAVAGKKAILKQEINFFADFNRTAKTKKTYPKGTVVVAVHEVMGTGLTTFTFKGQARDYEFPVREGKYEYIN